jgi:hypothetical protein
MNIDQMKINSILKFVIKNQVVSISDIQDLEGIITFTSEASNPKQRRASASRIA